MIEILSQKPVIAAMMLVGIFLAFESILRYMKHKLKQEFEEKKEVASDARDVENMSLSYNKRAQVVDLMRLAAIIFLFFLSSFLYDIQLFSYLLVALGALIIALRETVNSLFGYLFVLSHYDIGDDVRVNGTLGEIVRIKPILTSLAGKDDTGEYNGKLIHVPNFSFINSTVERQELKTDNYRRVVIQAVYNADSFKINFSDWLQKIKEYLDEELPMRKLEHVGNYRGFSGTRYKMNYDYDNDGEVFVKISFIADPAKALARKEKIVAFIESLRSTKKKK